VQTVDNTLFQLASLLGILKYDFEMDGLRRRSRPSRPTSASAPRSRASRSPASRSRATGLSDQGAMKAPHKLVLGNTGDALGYFIPSDEWQTGKNDNYEESVSLGKTAGDNARDNIVPLIEADNAKF
jgi:hypothetical protein